MTTEEFDAFKANKKTTPKALSRSQLRSGTHSGRGGGTASAVPGGEAEVPSPDSDSSSDQSEESVSLHNRLQ